MADTGRPSSFTQEIADEICFRMSEGESLNKICKDEHIPHRSTVMRWLLRDEPEFSQFRDKYEESRQLLLEYWAGDILDISDDDEQDTQRSRLRVDTRKWLLSKLAPRKYGDKVELTGPEGGAIQQNVEVTWNVVTPKAES